MFSTIDENGKLHNEMFEKDLADTDLCIQHILECIYNKNNR